MFKKKSKTQLASQKTAAVSLISLLNSRSTIAEQYRTIRTNIQFAASSDHPVKSIVITSSGPSEGKSLTAANLAIVFAKSGKKTLLLDGDMRKPTVWKTFRLSNQKGLSTLLVSPDDIADSIQKTTIDNLSVLTSGPQPPNPSELLGSTREEVIMDQLTRLFDVIIVDMPPVVTVTDAQIVASKADGTILVAREGVSEKAALLKAKQLLEIAHARILGVVYNGVDSANDAGYYYYSDK
ncbi:Capsular polysaccharide biosynthesis protein Cap5B [Bombilactobacillus mellifer]|uniref:Tyrosine-protein kinase CpsD n=1 Tax=Bombilactobacillus mellifer TaxID=1218492 RepID=A0A0F4LRK2_9LACO|nr:CpsD/CapB family tyrosine-protein kinase [Bombilactobacillus mellifer]MBH9991948.1 CpsD/CapB family tyrosine-protein kinase [Lactobacillus sp. W8092]KJY60948.1 Capsular polysaccharide biosynthesis protein Cap5B [Bombilactobacillus mellifer]MCT6826882.1 CpsD/CapB family tyrosine-protein kinase [Bombilactobacillus mellifer]MCT6843831.1 CpsD/CapB family tyrosine-protein kinase [Bombilactobacillus mellifer]MCT6894727.1 CpsD/CapB family tyrosine-protein kinase [Bombilactobacillus mellifer]